MANKAEHVIARIAHKRPDVTRVLVVVDKYVSGQTLKNLLQEWEYNITGICTSSQEALERINEDKPHLILTDIELNDCDGIYFTQHLNLQSDNSNLCIYFTAYASDSIVQRTTMLASAIGCDINKYNTEKQYADFESCFCQRLGIDITNNVNLPAEQPIKVLLVDDQQIVLWGLEKLINSKHPRMEVIGTATNISDAKQLVVDKMPDIIILNIYLDEVECVKHIPFFSSEGNARVMIFTDTQDKEVIDRAVLSGARGIVHRKESMETMLRAIEKIHEGELWLDRITTGRIFLQSSRMRGKVPPDTSTDKITMLTRKECMILRAFSDGTGGEQNKQIAAKLCMSEHTLRNHLTSIFSKLGVKNRFSLFAYAKQHFQQLESSVTKSLNDYN
ncbi:response regulator transcription factor [Nitrosomonas supralitoralis]|uniref:DNA-binding response regulator n=1 Tax=Nitrosomonas supralitoralis TaxID=2116706 RepID=A0A2P7NV62_9PROT|nr:DNA-binding response regulator [Nitrosomonas supralitoralis]PSJ17357.1 DNA-binding response regulator [Nitrosomonas supralitoralis]